MKINRLSEIFENIQEDDFVKNYLGKKFCILKGKDPHRFDDIFSWKTINHILNTQRLEYPRIRVVKNGSLIEEDCYMQKIKSRRGAVIPVIESGKISEEIYSGATLILDAVNDIHEPVNKFVSLFERYFSEYVQANAYTAVSDSQGFDLHWDSHDVFVVQITGKKYWLVYNPTRIHPMHDDIEPSLIAPTEKPVWEGYLNAGEILYLPRGWWHEARPMNSETIHLSIGINHKTGIDLIGWFKERLSISELFRTDLPKLENEEYRKDFAIKLKSEFDKIWNNDIISEFIEDSNQKAIPRSFNIGFPYSVDPRIEKLNDDIKVKLSTNRKVNITENGENIEVKTLGKNWEFVSIVKPIIFQLLDGEFHALEKLYTLVDIDKSQINAFILELSKKGFLIIEEKPTANKG
jgi:ribosomal protein L16 Arg81 hydroxylase